MGFIESKWARVETHEQQGNRSGGKQLASLQEQLALKYQ